MTLYMNRWTKPLHVFTLRPGDVDDLSDTPGPSGCVDGGTRALCGLSLDGANTQSVPDDGIQDPLHVLRVSQVTRFGGLEDFATAELLCETCRKRLALAWPPAAEYVESGEDPDPAGVEPGADSGAETEDAAETLEDLFT